MWELLSSLADHREVWLAATILSVGLFALTLIAIPILCVRMPTDFFVRPLQRRPPWKVALRSVAAGLLILIGLAMIVLPGQGLLTILLGVSLLDFPAKRAWQRRLLQRRALLRTINGIRRRAGRPPLETSPPRG